MYRENRKKEIQQEEYEKKRIKKEKQGRKENIKIQEEYKYIFFGPITQRMPLPPSLRPLRPCDSTVS